MAIPLLSASPTPSLSLTLGRRLLDLPPVAGAARVRLLVDPHRRYVASYYCQLRSPGLTVLLPSPCRQRLLRAGLTSSLRAGLATSSLGLSPIPDATSLGRVGLPRRHLIAANWGPQPVPGLLANVVLVDSEQQRTNVED